MVNFTKKDVERAIKQFLDNPIKVSKKVEYYINYEGKELPSKIIAGIAMKYAINPEANYVEYDRKKLKGGFSPNSAAKKLENLGYKIVKKEKLTKQKGDRTIINPEIDNYSEDELEKIDDELEEKKGSFSLKELPSRQEVEKRSGGSDVPKREPKVAAYALYDANYKCEFDEKHQTFIKASTGKNYTEPHHLIPISKYKEFNNVNLDVPENIVSLCSHCHNLLHYGRFEDKEALLKKLYEERKEKLKFRGIEITFNKLKEIYGG